MAIPNIGDIQMPYPIMPGAGVCPTPASISPYLQVGAPVGAAVTGPYTLFEETHGKRINMGIQRALVSLSMLPAAYRPCIVSFAGRAVEDYLYIVEWLRQYWRISGWEIDLGHPSTGGVHFSYSLHDVAEILWGIQQIRKNTGLQSPIWLKLSPYVTRRELDQMCVAWPTLDFTRVPVVSETFVNEILQIIASYSDAIQAVVFSGALPNIVAKKPETDPFDGRGGMSGDLLRPISIGLIKRAKTIAPNIDIIGCGSIVSANDAIDYFKAGAAAVQCVDCKPHLFTELKASARLEQYLA